MREKVATPDPAVASISVARSFKSETSGEVVVDRPVVRSMYCEAVVVK
jgi:hypothetical protein